MLIGGVDEAGRGPVVGPMVFSIVVVDSDGEGRLEELGVVDSKLLSTEERESMFKEIKKLSVEYGILSISALEITEWMKSASLNDIEAIKTAELLNKLKTRPDFCYVDCPDVNTARYSQNILNLCKRDMDIRAEHKADMNYRVVGAASILAKVTRDRGIKKLEREHGRLGSGYPGDPLTKEWLDRVWAENRRFPDIVRKRWSTVERKAQLRLTEW